jgi:hypothetical protein
LRRRQHEVALPDLLLGLGERNRILRPVQRLAGRYRVAELGKPLADFLRRIDVDLLVKILLGRVGGKTDGRQQSGERLRDVSCVAAQFARADPSTGSLASASR